MKIRGSNRGNNGQEKAFNIANGHDDDDESLKLIFVHFQYYNKILKIHLIKYLFFKIFSFFYDRKMTTLK